MNSDENDRPPLSPPPGGGDQPAHDPAASAPADAAITDAGSTADAKASASLAKVISLTERLQQLAESSKRANDATDSDAEVQYSDPTVGQPPPQATETAATEPVVVMSKFGIFVPAQGHADIAANPAAIDPAPDPQPSSPGSPALARPDIGATTKEDAVAPATRPAEATIHVEPPASTSVARGEPGAPSAPNVNGSGRRSGPSRGGNGGGGGSPPLEQRSEDRDFREVLTKGLAASRRNMFTVGFFSIAANLMVLSIPIYLFNVSDRVLTSRSVDTLVMLTTIVIGAIAGHVLLDMTRRFILMRVAVDAESRLGAPVLSAAAKAAQGGSNREFQTLADLQQIRSFLTGPVLLTMFDAPVAPAYLLVVFLIHPDLGFIVATSGLLLLTFALINQKVTAVFFARANGFSTRANLQAEAMARNAQVINAMGMIPEGVVIWGRETAESLIAQVRGHDRNIFMTGISKFMRLSTQIAILAWGATLALESQLTGGMIIAASIVGSRALAPLEGTIEGWRSFVQARSAYARIKSLLQNSPLNFARLRLPRPEGRLSVERILYVPPPNKKVILNGISFQLDPGESLAIVGASGTGKSTLARMLVGSIIPTAGNVRLDMMDLRNWDARQFGENVGYLPQDVQLFPASIKANIARMREDAADNAIFEAAEMADVHEMISEFAQGYETQISVDGSPLSGGQKQRIGLARAFFGNPRLIVLDEPNSNLDSRGERALANALLRAKDKGITVVTITQRPALLKSVDKIMILHNGAVQAFGKRDDLIPIITGRKPINGTTLPSEDGLSIVDT